MGRYVAVFWDVKLWIKQHKATVLMQQLIISYHFEDIYGYIYIYIRVYVAMNWSLPKKSGEWSPLPLRDLLRWRISSSSPSAWAPSCEICTNWIQSTLRRGEWRDRSLDLLRGWTQWGYTADKIWRNWCFFLRNLCSNQCCTTSTIDHVILAVFFFHGFQHEINR